MVRKDFLGKLDIEVQSKLMLRNFFTDYQPFYVIDILLDKDILLILEMPKLGVSEYEFVKISKERDFIIFWTNFGILLCYITKGQVISE